MHVYLVLSFKRLNEYPRNKTTHASVACSIKALNKYETAINAKRGITKLNICMYTVF